MLRRARLVFACCTLLFLALAASAFAADSKLKIAVLPFEVNAGPDLSYLHDSLPQLLVDRLRELDFETPSPDEVRQIIAQQKIDFLDISVAKDVALLAGANYAVYGSFSQVGETLSLDVRLVEAYGLKPAKPLFVVKQDLINILPALEELAEKIKNELLKKEVVAEVDVIGNKVLDKDVVFMRLGIKQGDVFDPKTINEQMKTVFNLGYFDDIKVRVDDLPEGKRVVFDVKEKPYIKTIGVVGSDALDSEDIIAAMNSKTGSVLNLKILADDLNKVRELYRKDGYYMAKVSYELEQENDTMARLNIVVKEGEKLYIRGIDIKGAEQLDQDDLKDQLALAERGMLSWITGSGVLKEEMLDRDAAALEAYYANRGFVDVKVGQPQVEFKDDGIFITFTVEEGKRYKVGNVTFAGDLLEQPDTLLTITKLDDLTDEDDYFDRSVLRSDGQNLTQHYSNFGYAFADVDYRVEKQTDALAVDVRFILTKNQKVYIRRVTIEGNDRTRDNVIRREVLLADGELFSGTKLRRSNERLKKTAYFEVEDIETVPTGNPNTLDLKIKVKEKTTGSLSGGLGYSTYDRFGVSLSLSELNAFGKGYKTILSGTFSGSSNVYNLSLIDPRFNDSPLGVGLDIYYRKDSLIDYDKITQGGKLRFAYPLGEYTQAFWGYRLDRYTIYNVDADAANLIRDIEGVNWASVLYAGAERDTTDDNLAPTRGTINKFTLANGGGLLMGDDNYVKGVYDSHYFHSLLWDTVFHFHAQAGFIAENTSDDVPVYERFHLGGINSIRGYPGYKISPIDEASGDRIGGNKEFFSNLEYIFPINKDVGLQGLTFFDIGNSWDDGDWDLGDLKKSVGAGLRFFTPMGLIRVEYGYALDNITDQGSHHKVEFTMGAGF
ncbi:MAG: outer membrane protein assembly factor BamA [Desulfovibrionaceae bacterium]